jgi:hypothetical protein
VEETKTVGEIVRTLKKLYNIKWIIVNESSVLSIIKSTLMKLYKIKGE